MADSQAIADASLLDTNLTQLKAALTQLGRGDLVQRVEDAMLAGSTGLEIHYLLRAALFQIRPEIVNDGTSPRLVDETIALINRIVHRNS